MIEETQLQPHYNTCHAQNYPFLFSKPKPLFNLDEMIQKPDDN